MTSFHIIFYIVLPVVCGKPLTDQLLKLFFKFFPDNMFNRQMQYGGSNKNPPSSNKEANLMPVPSPQQIQYLNPLEGQELTIQKQPNTSLRDQDLLSPS